MIRAVYANRPSFLPIRFTAGFNVILADRTKDSTRRDTRNGLGKSTLLEIFHFCLGARTVRGKGLLSPDLAGWEFILELDLRGRTIVVTRAVDAPATVRISGDTTGWSIQPRGAGQLIEGERTLDVTEWTVVLGELMFGIPDRQASAPAESGALVSGPSPSFRSLISYAIRRAPDGYLSPFEHFRRQLEWDRQLHTAYLLSLAWEDVRDWQLLRDRLKRLRALQAADRAGVGPFATVSVGELEAAKVRLERRVEEESSSLASFRVHERYQDLQVRANDLTRLLRAAANDNVEDQRVLSAYRDSVGSEREPSHEDVARIYAEAGVVLPGLVVRRLEEVQSFHEEVLSNRRAFLQQEIGRIERAIRAREADITRMGEDRAELMRVLQTHGALDEYVRIQQLHSASVRELLDVEQRIAHLRRLQQEHSAVKIDRETLQQRAQLDYEARRDQRERAIRLFNAESEALYSAPGSLIIDVTPDGYRFDVEIERAGSGGIEHMKIFCYDLMIASLWADRSPSPGFLVHDSRIFDGVDERQVAVALELAEQSSRSEGFQYICTLNSDTIPWNEFSMGFDLDAFVRRRLTDANEAGSLLGVRFDSRRGGGARARPSAASADPPMMPDDSNQEDLATG